MGTGWATRTRLPQDFIDKAVNRLGLLGLLSAVAHLNHGGDPKDSDEDDTVKKTMLTALDFPDYV